MYQTHKRYNKRIKVISKVRLIIFISILLLIIYPAILLAVGNPSNKQDSFIRVYIEAGDTLWDIARANLPPRTDIRDFVYRIKKVNRLDSSLIKEGDYLLVPIQP